MRRIAGHAIQTIADHSSKCFRALLRSVACVSLYQNLDAQFRQARLRIRRGKPRMLHESTFCVDEMTLDDTGTKLGAAGASYRGIFEGGRIAISGVSGRIYKGEGT